MKEQLLKEFSNVYGEEGDIEVYFAPGRVNMIGEHTDYNGGHVFPCALTIGTYVVIRKRSDQYMRFYSMNFEKLGVIESSIDKIEVKIEDNWANYPKGVVWTLLEKGYEIGSGFDMLVYGNIPNGSGLSSSASLEVVTSYALNIMFDLKIELVDLALLSQYAENHFIGVNCGIMDQFAIGNAKKNFAIKLDCSELSFDYCNIENMKIAKELVNIASENTTKLFDYPKIKSKQLKDMINLKIREKAIIATKARLIENSKNINDFSDEDLEIIIADEERKIVDDLKTKSLVVALAALGINFFV